MMFAQAGFVAYDFNHDKQKSYKYYRDMIQTLNPANTN